VIGGGSNLVLTGDFPGLVLHVAFHGRSRVQEDAEAFFVRAGGENWHDFVRWTLEMGWPGLENLSLIPGTVGAARCRTSAPTASRWPSILQPARLRPRNRQDGGLRQARLRLRLPGQLLQAGRQGPLPHRRRHLPPAQGLKANTGYADVARELEARASPSPRLQISDAVIAIRRRKLPDPAEIGNAGSFFKNPVVDAAEHARLIALHRACPAIPRPTAGSSWPAG
jgi:UDP-N-acetylmuramate dehydrogenase